MLAPLEANAATVKSTSLDGICRPKLQVRNHGKDVKDCQSPTEFGKFIQTVGQIGFGKCQKKIKHIAE